MLARLDRIVVRMSDGLALVGAIGVIAMLLHISAYVLMRLLLGSPIPATVEIVSRYYMVLIAFLPLAWAERRGDMISIEVFAGLVPVALRPWMDAFVALVTAGAYVVLTWTTWLMAMREFDTRSFVLSLNVAIPTWPGYFILPAGFGLAACICLYRAVAAVVPARPADTSASEGAPR